jgi:isopenicillin-N N-acyltransferase like protein
MKTLITFIAASCLVTSALAQRSDGSLSQASFTMNGNVATWEGTSVIGGKRVGDRGTDAVAPDGMGFTKQDEIRVDGKTWVPFSTRNAAKVNRPLRVLELSGSPYERGFQHGTQLRPQIAEIVALWKKSLRQVSKLDPDSLIKRFLTETDFTPAIKKRTPDLLDEVRGIAEGSGQPFETIFTFQLMDEIWVFMDQLAANDCSGLGVAKRGAQPACVAQNMDLEPFRDGFQTVLHIARSASTPEQFVFTCAGLIALNGVNHHSIAIACNTLMDLKASSDGLPVAFVVRGVLGQTNQDNTLNFVRNIKHASGQNYIIGAGDRVYDFEASAGKVVEFRPAADGNVVYHTNHRLVNDDLKRALSSSADKGLVNSRTRLASLQARLAKPTAAIDTSVIKQALQSKDSELDPVCCAFKADAPCFTFGATMMTLSDTPSLEVTMGPPDVNPFIRLEFSTAAKQSQPAEPHLSPVRKERALADAGGAGAFRSEADRLAAGDQQ